MGELASTQLRTSSSHALGSAVVSASATSMWESSTAAAPGELTFMVKLLKKASAREQPVAAL